MFLRCGAAHRAKALAASVSHLTEKQLEEARALELDFADAVRRHEAAHWGSLNAALHMKLYEASGLPRSLTIAEGLLKNQ